MEELFKKLSQGPAGGCWEFFKGHSSQIFIYLPPKVRAAVTSCLEG